MWHAFSIYPFPPPLRSLTFVIQQEVKALTRPEFLSKPINADLKSRGVEIIPVNLNGPLDKLIEVLAGVDVVISAIFFGSLADEIPLANAAKAAGVKRFVQSAFMVVVPPRGVVDFREKVTCPPGKYFDNSLADTLFLFRKKKTSTTSRKYVCRTHT